MNLDPKADSIMEAVIKSRHGETKDREGETDLSFVAYLAGGVEVAPGRVMLAC